MSIARGKKAKDVVGLRENRDLLLFKDTGHELSKLTNESITSQLAIEEIITKSFWKKVLIGGPIGVSVKVLNSKIVVELSCFQLIF